jgi:hypothetical protein
MTSSIPDMRFHISPRPKASVLIAPRTGPSGVRLRVEPDQDKVTRVGVTRVGVTRVGVTRVGMTIATSNGVGM